MDINNSNHNQEIERVVDGSKSPKNQRNLVLKVLGALLVLIAVFYGFNQLNKDEKRAEDYKPKEINQLGEEEQKRILEEQLRYYQNKAGELSDDASVSDKYTTYIKLAEIQNQLGLFTEAIATLDKIPGERTDNTRLLIQYSIAYMGLNDKAKARDYAQKAVAIDDEIPEYWQTYIEASQELPVSELEPLYLEALKKTVNNLEIVKSYARFLEKIGNTEKAIGYWETARNINPDGAGEYDAEIARLRN